MEVKQLDIVLCEFYFSSLNMTKKRPVLVFKDNLPYDDFVAIPISSKIKDLKEDEVLIDNSNFKNGNIARKSKLIIRKTFVVSKKVVIKKYGTISNDSFKKYHNNFCKYFGCNNDKK
jgi:mRNA interferase MazF